MGLHTQLRVLAADKGIKLSDGAFSRVAGTLRSADVIDVRQNLDLALRELYRETKENREFGVVAADSGVKKKEEDTFRRIDAGLAKGLCPKCSKPMTPVKLADYTPALFCTGECRVTLWSAEEAE